jgi:hypothetical protein
MIPTPLLACAAAASLIAAGTATGYALGNANVEPHTPTVTEQVTAPPVTRTVKVTERVTQRASRSESRTVPPTTASTPTPVRYYNPEAASGVYQDYARRLVVAAEWPCLRRLWQNESGWNPRAVSPSGRHVGIPQLIGLKTTDGWKHQIKRGLAYIDARYGGSPCRALAHYNAVRWY